MSGILVADDEGVMLESTKSITFSNFGSECEVMCVKTGRAVVKQTEASRPDIASADTQIPGLSDIQATREVRKFNSSMVFVTITAHDRFSYTQEAVNLGIMEFITKPVDKKEMLEASIRAVWQAEEARQKLSDDLKIGEKLEPVVLAIESGFIYNSLQNGTDIHKSDYLDMLGTRKQYGFMVVLKFRDSMVDELMTNAAGANVRVDKYYNQPQELVEDYPDYTIGLTTRNRIILLAPFDSEKTHYEERVEVIIRARNMIHKLEGAVDVRFRGGISTARPVRGTRDSCREALRALREGDSHVVHIIDIPAVTGYDGEYPLELEVQYFQRGVKAGREGAVDCASESLDWTMAHTGNVGANIEVRVLELVMRLEQKVWEMGCAQYGFCYRENYLNEIQGVGDMNAPRH